MSRLNCSSVGTILRCLSDQLGVTAKALNAELRAHSEVPPALSLRLSESKGLSWPDEVVWFHGTLVIDEAWDFLSGKLGIEFVSGALRAGRKDGLAVSCLS